MVANHQLRYNARQQLGNGIFRTAWLNMLCVCAVLPVSSALFTATGFGVLLAFIVAGALEYGIARVTTNCAQGRSWGVSQVFCAFDANFVKTLVLNLVRTIFLFLWTLLFIIPGIIKSYSYALTYYLQQEPENVHREPVDLITQSREWMNGYKWKLFCLDLSFIGWYLLGLLCLGVGVLFVTPYHRMARANFYLALRAEKEATSAFAIGEPFEVDNV